MDNSFYILCHAFPAPLSTVGAARASIWSLVFSIFFVTLLGILLRDNVTYADCQPIFFNQPPCDGIRVFVLVAMFFISWLVLHLMLFYIGPSSGGIGVITK